MRPSVMAMQVGQWLQGRSLLGRGAVERLGQDAGRAGLARAARPGEEIGVGHPLLAQGIAQRLGDVLLADDLVKGLAAPLAVECG